MLTSLVNFLYDIKQIVVGNSRGAGNGSVPADGGYNQDVVLELPVGALGTSTVMVTDAGGLPCLSTAASNNLVTTIGWSVPRDYDQNTDKFLIRVVTAMNGNTDSPTLTLISSTVLPAGTMNSADALNTTATNAAASTVTGSTVTAIAAGVVTISSTLSSTMSIFEFPMSGLGLIRDSFVTFKLSTGAHTTNGVLTYGIEIVYASCLVGFKESVNTAGKALGYDAFLQPIR